MIRTYHSRCPIKRTKGDDSTPKIKGLTIEQKVEYQRKRVSEECEFQMMKQRIKKTDIARCIGVTPQAVAYQFRNKSISVDVLIAVVTLSDMDPANIKDMLTAD